MRGKIVDIKPARFLQFFFLNMDFSARIFGRKANHELVGKRPTLAAEVADILHFQARFFANLPSERLLKRFAVLYKAGNARIDILIALHVARQQDLIASAYDHDHAGLYLREMQALTLRTFPCGEGGGVGQCRSAMRAETHAASPAEQAPGARIMKILLL